jgi:hypothetical protein
MERIEKQGMARFVLIWGGLWAFSMIVFGYAFGMVENPWYIQIPVMFICGIGWGTFMWFFAKWQYRKARKRIADSN